jgi:DegV family protein with EDD domain
MRVKILADSTCDLSDELLKKYAIRQIPLSIIKGEDALKDRIEITPPDIFEYVSDTHNTCSTSAINVAEYMEVFAEEAEKGYDALINFTISSELSACFANALIAAQELADKGLTTPIYSVDTQSLSTGGGWLVIYAAELVAEGMSAQEIVAACEEKKLLSDTSFVIDTLDYLHKGGRCSGLAAFGASLLNLKPCLNLIDGKIEVGKKYHGSIEKSLLKYIEDRIGARDDLDLRRAFVTHTFYDDPHFVDEVVEIVQRTQAFREVITTTAGCTVANHCGPKTLGVLVYKDAGKVNEL